MGKWKGAIFAAAMAILASLAASSRVESAVVICRAKNKLRLRVDACKARETRVDAAELGVVGPPGPPGSFTQELPSGKTVRGAFFITGDAAGADAEAGTDITFGFALSAAPTPHFIVQGLTPPTECPGNAGSPAAQPGQLCIYESFRLNAKDEGLCSVGGATTVCPGAGPLGAGLFVFSVSSGQFQSAGTWAVTAP
jgi:hypothetical protein